MVSGPACFFLLSSCFFSFFFFFNDTATTEIYTLSLHDALPSSRRPASRRRGSARGDGGGRSREAHRPRRSEEHTSELQSRGHLVCRLLLEKKNTVAMESSASSTNHGED